MIVWAGPQPAVQFTVTRQPCECVDRCKYVLRQDFASLCDHNRMVSRFFTAAEPCPEHLIGERIALASTEQRPIPGRLGSWNIELRPTMCMNGSVLDAGWEATHLDADPLDDNAWRKGLYTDLRLGCIVGSATVAAVYPIVADPEMRSGAFAVATVHGDVHVMTADSHHVEFPGQAPLSVDWSPGRYAVEITDAAPITERCPWCWQGGLEPGLEPCYSHGRIDEACFACWNGDECRICKGRGWHEPIPVYLPAGWSQWEPT